MQARYYDPVIGRFYSNDPVGFTGEVDTFNRYSYVANNPYKYTDPDGKQKERGFSAGALVAIVLEVTGLISPETSEAMISDATGKKKGTSGGKRAGKKHTRAAIKEAKKQNAAKNGGVVKCETCGVETTPGTQRTKGSTVNPKEGQGDHIQPRSKGCDGATVKDQKNIDIKCADCNNKKSDN